MLHATTRVPVYPRTALFAFCLLGACNSVPLDDLTRTFTGKVKVTTDRAETVKLDVLWVIDNSSSMGQEQVALGQAFESFIDGIFELDVDLRVAVTTTDDSCNQGVFSTDVAKQFDAAAELSVNHLCIVDDDCLTASAPSGEPDDGPWKCMGTTVETLRTNSDGSVNTRCIAPCEADSECTERFGDTFVCNTRGFCQTQAQTGSCPDTLGPVLDGDEAIDGFQCLASVGISADRCQALEQGLAAGFNALNPDGPQAEQSAAFLRDDAFLVVIFVSDEDDCSVRDGATISAEEESVCAVDPDVQQRLRPVSDYINLYKSLKPDGDRVIVAAISGDTLETDPAAADLARDAWVEAKAKSSGTTRKPYICQSGTGVADWGSRYQAFTEGFGAQGVFANLCGDGGVNSALQTIAERIRVAVGFVCLPRAPMDNERVEVAVCGADGTVTPLVEGTDADYTLIRERECPLQDVAHNAIDFQRELAVGEEFCIEYQLAPRF